MNAIVSLILGYLFGCISPAAWLSKKHNVDLKKTGTGNLGATNTAFVLGKRAGIFVLVFDMCKSILAYRLARRLLPQLAIAGILACIGVILGHCFPFFLRFQGGKGLAAFAGLVLAYNPLHFLMILVSGVIAMFLFDTGVAATVLGTCLFPILVFLNSGNWDETLAVCAACALIFIMHRSNIRMAFAHRDVVRTREFFRKVFGKP